MEFVLRFLVGKEFYILYKVVMREVVKLMKFWIVYDVLVCELEKLFFFNECFEVGLFL